MRGGTNSSVKVNGSCLKPSKTTQWVNLTRPSLRRQTQAHDTKVTIISQDKMDTLKSEINTPMVIQKQSYQEVLRGGDWGPPISSPKWNTTSETFLTQPKSKEEHKPLQQVVIKKVQVEQVVKKNPILTDIVHKVNPVKKVQSRVVLVRPTLKKARSHNISGYPTSKSQYKPKKHLTEIKENEDWPKTSALRVTLQKNQC